MYTLSDEDLDIDEQVQARESISPPKPSRFSQEIKERFSLKEFSERFSIRDVKERFTIKEVKDIWNKAINKNLNVNQEEYEELEKKTKDIKSYFQELMAFIENLINADRYYAREVYKILESWRDFDELGIGSR